MAVSKKEILIIENQKLNQNILRDILEPVYEIICAEDGQEALEIIQNDNRSIRAIVLDVSLSAGVGCAFIEAIRKNPKVSEMPILATSSSAEDACELEALNVGANDFVSQPYHSEILKKRLHNLIQIYENTSAAGMMEKDQLTGLYSKEGFSHKVDEILKGGAEEQYDIAALDIEHFKLFNDTYGVEEGDRLLKFIAEKMLEESEAAHGICARIYADRFMIFMERQQQLAANITERINQAVEGYPLDMKVHVKSGVYEITDITVTVNSMCDRALIAVKAAKGCYGKDVAYYDDSIREKLLTEQQIVDGMVHALQEEQFEVYFQPKYELDTEKMVGAEALVRWQHPVKGFMSPGDFIPIFEKNGFITELDMYVWEKSCQYMAQWKEKYGITVPVSVNVSRKDIYKQELPKLLSAMVEKYGLKACDLHLEITESAYTENPEQLVWTVERLKERGFMVEMDDFGSGYSSLNVLAELPIDILKLDMKFLQNKGEQRKNESIMSSVVELAKKIDLNVIAEGVEKEMQIEMLKSMKCDMVQGYYYARPMPAEQFEKTCLL